MDLDCVIVEVSKGYDFLVIHRLILLILHFYIYPRENTQKDNHV